jgi:hypothetical protein
MLSVGSHAHARYARQDRSATDASGCTVAAPAMAVYWAKVS